MSQSVTTNNALTKRDVSIDILRFIGLSLIILAHVSPPDALLQIRCFDVPMMLFISGLTMRGKAAKFSWSYIKHRTLRLLIPVYSFLTAYFILIFALQNAGLDFGVTLRHCISSYLLLDGIGFIWIIRVFLLVALLTPCLIWIAHKCSTKELFAICAFSAIGLDCLIREGVMMEYLLIRDFLYYAIGYSIPLLCALKASQLNLKGLSMAALFFFCLLAAQYAIVVRTIGGGNYLMFNNFKYPPQAYYIFYGIFVSLFSYILIIRCNIYKALTIFSFVGCNTIWIYLYHIPIIQLTGHIGLPWFVRYIVVYVLAFSLCYIQVTIVNILQKKYEWAAKLNFLKG